MDAQAATQMADVQLANQPDTQTGQQPLVHTQPVVVAPPMPVQNSATQPPMTAQGFSSTPQTIILNYGKPSRPRIRKNYKGKVSMILGIIQIVCAVVMIIAQAAGYSLNLTKRDKYHSYDTADGYDSWFGIWCAVLIILGGSFATAAGKHRHICLIVTAMVLSIISSLFSVVVIGLASWIVDHDSNLTPYYYYYKSTPPNYDYVLHKQQQQTNGSLAMGALMLIAGIISMVTAIVTSALCCAVACCCAPDSYSADEGAGMLFVNAGGGQIIQLPQTHRGPVYLTAPGGGIQPTAQTSEQPPPYTMNTEAAAEKAPIP